MVQLLGGWWGPCVAVGGRLVGPAVGKQRNLQVTSGDMVRVSLGGDRAEGTGKQVCERGSAVGNWCRG